MRILLVLEGAADELAPIRDALGVRGHHVTEATYQDAIDDVTSSRFAAVDLIVVDAELAEQVDLVSRLAAASPGIEVILVGQRRGPLPADVVGQVGRPIDVEQLLEIVDDVADILDGARLGEPIEVLDYETLFAGDSPAIRAVLRRVRLVARSDAPVWVYGDDGSGRAIIARAIHDRSSRRNHPFLAFNTAALSDEELANRLFHGDQPAVVTAANGTVFLEQVSTAGPQTQRELMQFLDKKRSDEATISARLVVGVQPVESPTGLERLFAPELYYRLKVLEVEIPRLRDRARDLQDIVRSMLQRLAGGGRKPPEVTTESMRLLEGYSFPGNLLELAHALTHAVVLAHGSAIEPRHLPASIRGAAASFELTPAQLSDLQSLDSVAKRFERDYLLRVLRAVGGNRGRAAEILGLSRKGLWGKLKSHGISDDDIEGGDDASADEALSE